MTAVFFIACVDFTAGESLRPWSHSAGAGAVKLKFLKWLCFTREHEKKWLHLALRSFREELFKFPCIVTAQEMNTTPFL